MEMCIYYCLDSVKDGSRCTMKSLTRFGQGGKMSYSRVSMTLSKTGQDPTKREKRRVSDSLRDEGGKMFKPVDHKMMFHSTGISTIYSSTSPARVEYFVSSFTRSLTNIR